MDTLGYYPVVFHIIVSVLRHLAALLPKVILGLVSLALFR